MNDARRRKFLLRGGLVAGLAGLLVAAMLTPSIGGSILTKKQANKTFLSKKKANKQFLKKAAAQQQFLSQSQAVRTAVATSTSLPGLDTTSTTEIEIPGASANITVPAQQESATLVATFSGVSLCRNTTFGFSCSIKVLVDGEPANPTPDASGYIWDTTEPAGSAPNKSLSLTVSKSVGPGEHTVQVRYSGGQTGTQFVLRTWHLQVETFPN